MKFKLEKGEAAFIVRKDLSAEYAAPGIEKGDTVDSNAPAGVCWAFMVAYHNEDFLKKILEYPKTKLDIPEG